MNARLVDVPAPVTVRVPAKVNLHLAVGDRRDDGYHELVTVFHAVSLFDEVVASPSRTLTVTVRGEGAGQLPTDSQNLAYRAAELLAKQVGVDPAVRLDLVKGIPVAGGLAGGSADAAAALVACDALWGTALPREELVALAAQLGSDVAFALVGGTALGTGRGERLSPVPTGGHRRHWVLAVADGGLSTPLVYGELDRMRAEQGDLSRAGAPDALLDALRSPDAGRLGALLCNDLQPAALALRPDLRRTLQAGVEAGAAGGLVSGSGPTCAFLAHSAQAAVRLATELSRADVARTVRVAYGPVPGARVVE